MDLLEKLDNLLNKDAESLEVNNFYSNADNINDNNVAEKEDDPKSVKDLNSEPSLELEHENDDFQDCYIFSEDDDDNEYNFLSTDDDDVTDEDCTSNTETIEQFLKNCESITNEISDEKLNELIENESTQKTNEEEANKIDNTIEKNIDNTKQDSDEKIEEEQKTDNQIETNKLFPEKIIDIYDPDFESLELRINQLWKQIDEIQEQIKEEKSFSKEEAKEIQELLSKSNTNDIMDSNNKNTCTEEQKTKNQEKINNTNNKTMESKGTNTFISAQTEARVNAKKELLKRMNIKNKESEAKMFKRKLKEVEELCAIEMNKVTNIISQLNSLQNESEMLSYDNKLESITDQLNLYKNPMRIKSNISLPDATKLKYLANKFHNTTNDHKKQANLLNNNEFMSI